MNGHEFVAKLNQLGYFCYTANENINALKQSIIKYYEMDKCLMVDFCDQPPYLSLDKRFCDCGDCEKLFEEDGVPNLIEIMKPFFGAAKFEITYTDDKYSADTHTIIVNGTKYLMAEGSILGWGETFVNYAKMINSEMLGKKCDELLYLFTYDDSEYLVFLTQYQYQFLYDSLDFDKRPLTINEWITKALGD